MKADKKVLINYDISANEQEMKFLLSGLRYLLASELYNGSAKGQFNHKENEQVETERKHIDRMISLLESQLKRKL
jgi:hypothetical protein